MLKAENLIQQSGGKSNRRDSQAYRVEAELVGRGTFGMVYGGERGGATRCPVAIKVFPKWQDFSAEVLRHVTVGLGHHT